MYSDFRCFALSKKTLKAVKQAKCEAILQVKDNQKTLLKQCRSIADDYLPSDCHISNDKAHGRQEKRIVTVVKPPKHKQQWLKSHDWQHIQVVVKVERIRKKFNTRTKAWDTSSEQSHYISTTTLTAEQFSEGIRQHWGIENKNHHVRDVALQEDASRIRRNPQNFAILRSFALNIMRHNKVKNVQNELYKNTLSFENILKYELLF
ncbi:MAG: ISAs1 family transposase [Desulfocapsa sp.]|nr:MAG: ISAs1 family transposase [Desulfocapsa sp.]